MEKVGITGFSELADKYNMVMGAIVTVLTMLFGKYWFLFAIFFFLNIVDYISGWAKARMLKTESSAIGALGIVKKVWYWVVIAVSFMISYCFMYIGQDSWGIDLSFIQFLGWWTLAQYAVNEARSFTENLVEMDIKVPTFFTRGLAVAELMIKKGLSKAGELLTKEEEEEEKEISQ